MEIKLSKDGLTRTGVVLLLLSGLVFHDFFILSGVKLGPITITYLRVVLVVCVPLLLFFYKVKIRKNDILAYFLIVFMLYGLTRIEGNFKEAFAIYCPLIAFYFLYFAIDDKKIIDKCVDFMAGMLVFFCVVGLIEVISGNHFVETHLDDIDEIKHVACGMYYNENDFSAFLSVMIVFMYMSHYKMWIKLLSILCSFTIIIINKSVICILGLVVLALFIYLIRKKANRLFRFIIVIMLTVILIKPVNDLIKSSSLWARSYMYSFGIKNVLSHLLIGTGIGNYAEEMISLGFDSKIYIASADPHNLFYELAGVFGAVWAILFIILLIKLAIWNLKKSNRINMYYFGLILLIPFIGLASSSCMEKNYIYLALLIPTTYYRYYINNLQMIKSNSLPVSTIIEYENS